MADSTKIAQMLEHLVNEDQAKAEELFHEYVVEKSREIYEGLIEDELDLEEGPDQTDDLLASVEDDAEGMEDGEEGDDGDDGEEGDNDEESDDGDEDEPATKGDIADLADVVRQLEDELANLVNMEQSEEPTGDFGDMDLEKEDFGNFEDTEFEDLETVREYVEKVGAGHGAEKKGAGESNVNAKSIVAGKNDMGGTTANIAKGGEGSNSGTTGGLLNPSTKEEDGGNVNVPGSKTATKLNSVAKGHGAEKSGAKEDGGVNKTSLFRK